MDQIEFSTKAQAGPPGLISAELQLLVTLDVHAGGFHFEWRRTDSGATVARGNLGPTTLTLLRWYILEWALESNGKIERDQVTHWPASVRAFLKRLRNQFPTAGDRVQISLLSACDFGPAKAGVPHPIALSSEEQPWKWLAREIQRFASVLNKLADTTGHEPAACGTAAAQNAAGFWLGISPDAGQHGTTPSFLSEPGQATFALRVTIEMVAQFILLEWNDPQTHRSIATGWIRCTGRNELTWTLETNGRKEAAASTHHLSSIRASLNRWLDRFPAEPKMFTAVWVRPQSHGRPPLYVEEPAFHFNLSPWSWLAGIIQQMGQSLASDFSPIAKLAAELDPLFLAELQREEHRRMRKEQKLAEEEARRRQNLARLAEERRRHEQRAGEQRRLAAARNAAAAEAQRQPPAAHRPTPERSPLPPVPVHVEFPALELQETTFPLVNLSNYSLRERAALWWVSNQSDDLLCLPHCHIKHLDYQVRTALRVLGPLRGRALLSDEVGLGKTIEAGLVLKELLTRGMVKRFLVLTVPSLVDQWEEELSDKFGLATVTTNHAVARADTESFWRNHPALVASLHTLKQPAQLAIARQVHWDMLIVDEAHYLRNRDSQAWQAVNTLPRHFLLLLTATPVQNSLEELYNLVTLLQPGQLPTPKEFRTRFIDPKRPRQPREPEELRRLLGQVMIRNTRANSGINLPPRHAETVLFEPDDTERAFWKVWEAEFRACLGRLSPSQASLWGRLLLQAAGSSPAAWRDALEKFPDADVARSWRDQAPLEGSWLRKCELLPPLTRIEGGAVIFTQFLQTQAALVAYLRGAGVETFFINGATPAAERQPITEEFHRRGGALLLTHSGTEGRNLQFSHRLANFDLPWNPMEIEQRIGRLHRLGQQHPVRIYNFVQAGTLQEHLLQILQEKLNLFELVVGETGLVLGERFSSDEFAEEVLRRWRESEGRVAEALTSLGDELAASRDAYNEVKTLDETLFKKDYESL
jgi:hypothetical protein